MQSSSGNAPLAGVRVADLSRVLAGPYCTMVLADLGADVVKVERPQGGDETRSWGPPFAGGEAAYYLSVNRSKRSCALDLSQPEGRALALELCAGADVVIENFKVGGADRLGVGYEQVRERNPRVVYCSITGFGSEREPRGRPGYDFVAQAESGLMSITGPEEGPPYKVGVALVDVLAGLHAASAVLAALHGGEGARIEVPLLDSGLAGLVNVAQNALVTGADPERHGNAHPNIVPYQDFETSSGRIAVAAANDGLFRALCSVMGLDEPQASVPGEIVILKGDWYDFAAKYDDGGMELVVPARLPETVREEIRRLAVDTFTRVGCAGLARVDFFVEGDRVLVNELNTMPGFTETSAFPKLWEASGVGPAELCDRLLAFAVERYEAERSGHEF